MALTITSPAFKEGETIPKEFTCSGADKSPELKWSDAPAGTVAFVLIMDDPDAPMGTWDHWILYNVGGDATGLAAAAAQPDGAAGGLNSWKKTGYGGPCPPPGKPHRYFFKLYALDAKLDLKGSPDKAAVEAAMKGHILGEAKLMGKFARTEAEAKK